MSKNAYLIVAHGSRNSESNQAFFRLLDQMRESTPNQLIEGAFLELAKPTIPEGIESCIKHGVLEIVVVPLMLFPGRHVQQDIPQMIQDAKEKHPNLDFHYSGPLCENSKLKNLIADSLK